MKNLPIYLCVLFLMFCRQAVSSQSDGMIELLPDRGKFEYNIAIDVAVDEDTALVASEWKNQVYVFQRDDSGHWQQQSILMPDKNLPKAGVGSITDFGRVVSLQGNRAIVFGNEVVSSEVTGRDQIGARVFVFSRNADNQWIQSAEVLEVSDSFSYRDVNAVTEQLRILTLASRSGAYLNGIENYRIYRLNSSGAWDTEFEVSIPESSNRDFCLSDEASVIGTRRYERNSNGQWRDAAPAPPGRRAFNSNVSFSADCNYAFYLYVFDGVSEYRIYRYNDSLKTWDAELNISDVNHWENAVINDRYAVVHQSEFTVYGPDAVVVFERVSGSWVRLGELEFKSDTAVKLSNIRMALDNNLLLRSELDSGSVTAYDLALYDFTGNDASMPVCQSGYADPDNDGFGWENDATCSVSQSELGIGDPQRDEFFQVDQSYTGPMPPGVFSGNTAALLKYSEEDQTAVVEISRTRDSQNWYVEASIDLNSVFSNTSIYTASISRYLRYASVDLQGDTLAVGLGGICCGTGFTGVVSIFKRDENSLWNLVDEINPPVQIASDDAAGFARSVKLSSDQLAVSSGHGGGESGNPGTVHIYRNNGQDKWSLDSEITNPRPYTPSRVFAGGFAMDGDTLMVSTGYRFVDIYHRDSAGHWSPEQVLYGFNNGGFDVVGNNAFLVQQGKLRVFTRDATGFWAPTVTLTGGDMVVRSGRLWAADEPIDPAQLYSLTTPMYPVTYIGALTTVADADLPITACVDTGLLNDGWGWDGTSSCRVATNTGDIDATMCIDTDGDGWGWDGQASCRVALDSTLSPGVCVDVDGDGYGWNGAETCFEFSGAELQNENTNDPYENVPCIDTDGDGWGWQQAEGLVGRSCRI